MKKIVWKIVAVITLVLALGAASAASAEEEDVPLIYSITVPFVQ